MQSFKVKANEKRPRMVIKTLNWWLHMVGQKTNVFSFFAFASLCLSLSLSSVFPQPVLYIPRHLPEQMWHAQLHTLTLKRQLVPVTWDYHNLSVQKPMGRVNTIGREPNHCSLFVSYRVAEGSAGYEDLLEGENGTIPKGITTCQNDKCHMLNKGATLVG